MRPLDSRGQLTIPLLLALGAVSLLGVGTWGVMRHWRHLTELQLRLDRCVGQTALDLRATLTRIETANRNIQRLREAAALAVAAGQPLSLGPAIQLEVVHQELEIGAWRARQLQWLATRGCGDAQGLPWPLPSMAWWRPPPDLLGPQPLQWQPGQPRRLRLQLTGPPRAAAALVQSETNDEESQWKAAWTAPRARPGID